MTKPVFDWQDVKFRAYGFLKNLQFFEAFLLLYLLDRGISYTMIGILYAVREITTNLLEIPSGIAADALGRRRTLAASFLAYIGSFVLFYLFSSPVPYMLAFLLYGAGEAFRSGTHKGMIADYLRIMGRKERMTDYYGKTRSWSQLGSAVSSLFAGFIVFFSGKLGGIFLFSIIPFIINFFMILSYPRFLDEEREGERADTGVKVREVVRSTFKALSNRRVFNLLNLTALHTAYLKAIKDYIQPILVTLALGASFLGFLGEEQRKALFIGIVYFLIYLLNSRASYHSPKLAGSSVPNIPLKTLLAGLAAGALSGFFKMTGLAVLSLFFFAAVHFVENLRKPIMTGYVTENVGSSVLTSVLSVQSQLKTVFTALIALVLGFFADRFGVGMALLAVSGGLIFFTLLLQFLTRRAALRS